MGGGRNEREGVNRGQAGAGQDAPHSLCTNTLSLFMCNIYNFMHTLNQTAQQITAVCRAGRLKDGRAGGGMKAKYDR